MLNYSWSNDYSVGNDTLNDHHKNLLNLFNDACNLITNKGNREHTIKLISELRVYSIFHFREEEKLMKAAGYDNLDAHIKEHKKFISDVETFKASLTNDAEGLNEELFIFLSNWLMNHIQKTDMAYKGKI